MRWLQKLSAILRYLPKVLGVAALVVIIAWMSYGFQHRVEPGDVEYERPQLGDRQVVTVRTLKTTQTTSAVGTVQPRRKTEIASRLQSTILEITVNPGDQVTSGQTLVTLDDREIQTQLREAEAAVAGMTADLAVRERDYRRYKQMFAEGAVTKEDYDRIEGAFQVTRAQLERAQQQVERIKVMLTYTRIMSPEDAIVSGRFADPGDLAASGKPILVIHNPTELELHASVRESLAAHLWLGQKLRLQVDAVHIDTEGTVREIVPRADVTSRSVLVKVALPQQPQPKNNEDRLYVGMFGRLHIPVGQLDRVVIATAAVQRLGQLDVVDVVSEQNWLERRYIRLGEQFGDDVEVLSGLRVGERVAVPGSDATHEAPASASAVGTSNKLYVAQLVHSPR